MPKRPAGALRRLANLGHRAIKRIRRSFSSKSSGKENYGSQRNSTSKPITVDPNTVSQLNTRDRKDPTTILTSQHDPHTVPTRSFPPDPTTPASVSLMPNHNRFSSTSQRTICIMEEIEDIDRFPASNSLQYDPFGPLVIKVPEGSVDTRPGVIWDIDDEESALED